MSTSDHAVTDGWHAGDTELEARVSEFERAHAADLRLGGPGWVPRIQARDYVIAGLVNLGLIVWLVV